MSILNNMRYTVWKILEQSKNDSICKRKENIEKCITDDSYYSRNIQDHLENIIKYASEKTVFYEAYKGKKFEDYPIINKNIIMNNRENFESSEFKGVPVHVKSTSGSTGIPFKINQDVKKRKQVLAELLYFSELIGYYPGKKLIYLRNLETGLKKSKWKQFLQNEAVISVQKYNDETLKKIVNQIQHMEKKTTILGYASTLQVLANYMERKNIVLNNITGIISGAEAITNRTRKLVEKQFNCPVVSRYSNQEMGILGQDSKEDEFLLNRASYYFEMLALDKDEPVPLGEIGRIVITDLYNHAMPLIRYDTGDLGIMKKNAKGQNYLAKVLGRKLDLLYNTSNEPLSFFSLDECFEENLDIEQFQIIQEDRFHLIINLIMKQGKSIEEASIRKKVQKIMGKECNVEIRYSEQIPITNSGKFRYVICNYQPDNK